MGDPEMEYAKYLARHLKTAFSFEDWCSQQGIDYEEEFPEGISVIGISDAIATVLSEKLR